MFCGPSTVVYNGSTSRREGRTTRGVSGQVCRPRERRLPCPPLPPLRMLTWSDLGRFDAPFIKRKKRKEIFVRIPVNSFLFCTAVCRWLGFMDCVCSGEKALALMRPPAASARNRLATRGQESPSLSQVSEGPRGRRWKGARLPEAKRTRAHAHPRGPAPQRGAMGPSPAGRRNPLWPGVGETRE